MLLFWRIVAESAFCLVHHFGSNYSDIEKLLMRALYLVFMAHEWARKRNFLTRQYGYYVTNFRI